MIEHDPDRRKGSAWCCGKSQGHRSGQRKRQNGAFWGCYSDDGLEANQVLEADRRAEKASKNEVKAAISL